MKNAAIQVKKKSYAELMQMLTENVNGTACSADAVARRRNIIVCLSELLERRAGDDKDAAWFTGIFVTSIIAALGAAPATIAITAIVLSIAAAVFICRSIKRTGLAHMAPALVLMMALEMLLLGLLAGVVTDGVIFYTAFFAGYVAVLVVLIASIRSKRAFEELRERALEVASDAIPGEVIQYKAPKGRLSARLKAYQKCFWKARLSLWWLRLRKRPKAIAIAKAEHNQFALRGYLCLSGLSDDLDIISIPVAAAILLATAAVTGLAMLATAGAMRAFGLRPSMVGSPYVMGAGAMAFACAIKPAVDLVSPLCRAWRTRAIRKLNGKLEAAIKATKANF